MSTIADVLILDVSGQIDYRDTKHGVCISVSNDKYLLINTVHREMYDDFEIKSSDYDFLDGRNRFVCCSTIHRFAPDKIIRRVGRLHRNDVEKIVNRIQASIQIGKMEKASVIPDLATWLSANTH